MGGHPRWSFEPFPYQTDLVKVFESQLEKEKLALELHRQAARLAPSASLGEKFNALAKEEQGHIQVVKDILARLA